MTSKKNKNGSALVFAMVILSIGTVVALSIAASAVITRKGASSTERASRSFQEIDSASDAFDRVFETTDSFLCHVRDYYDADGNTSNSSLGAKCCRGNYNEDSDTCDTDTENNHRIDFGTCQSTQAGSDNSGTIITDDGSVIGIFGIGDTLIRCDAGIEITQIRKTKIISTADQNKRAIENVPPCAGFDPDTGLIGHWRMNSLKTATTIDDESVNSNDMELKYAVASGESIYKNFTSGDEYLPEIERFDNPDGTMSKNALSINKNYNTNGYTNINHANEFNHPTNPRNDRAEVDTINHVNSRFNFAQIPPIDAYAVPEGTVSFWFYSTNPNPTDWGFTPYSRDITNCVNEDLVNDDTTLNGDNWRLTRENLTSYTWNGWIRLLNGQRVRRNGLCQNEQNDYWPYPTGSEKPDDISVSELNYYNDVDNNLEHICDCGHMSFMWNPQYWDDVYNDKFGTRFQNDGNGSHYRLRSSTMTSAEIAGKWHLATITFNTSGAYLYFDEELRGTIQDGSSPPWPEGTYPLADPLDPLSGRPFKFNGLAGNFLWTYIGMFAGDMSSGTYNELDPNDPEEYRSNGTRYLTDKMEQDFDSNKMLFYPFRGGIRELRLYNKMFKECEVRRLWWVTKQ